VQRLRRLCEVQIASGSLLHESELMKVHAELL
jgi:hypothetical protein